MSDINDPIPFINYGQQEAEIGNTNANTNLTGLQSRLVQQQTQGAAIQNAQAAISYQLYRNALLHMPSMDFNGSSDSSGSLDDIFGTRGLTAPHLQAVAPGTAANAAAMANTPVGGGSPTTVSAGGAPVNAPVPGATPGSSVVTAPDTDSDDVGLSDADPAAVETQLRNQWAPQLNPAGTPQEQQMVLAATRSGNPQFLSAMVTARDQGVASRTSQVHQYASDVYDTLTAVTDAPDGMASSILQKIAPGALANLKEKYPDDTPEELDERVRDWTAHVAANVHQYSGRALEKREDGVYVDSQTGLPVTGVPISGMSAQQYEDAWHKANTLVDVKQSNNTIAQVKQYAVAGFSNASSYIAAAGAQAKALQQMPSHPSFAGTPIDQPGMPSQTAATAQAHVAALRASGQLPASYTPPSGAAPGGNPNLQPVPVTAQRVGVAPPSAPAQPDNGLLPGVNPDALPKIQLPPVRAGVSQTPLDAANVKMIGDERTSQMQAASQASADDAKQRSLIAQAQNELAHLNPRTVGPGASYYNDFLKTITAATGKAPNDYVDQVVLDKFLNQIGAGNVRQLLQGQRITNQEMMTFLTRGSPSTEQPLAGIQRIVGYMGADNDYDSRLQKTKLAALQRGADPFQLNSALETASSRSDYIRQRTGMNPLTGSNGPARVNSAADYAAVSSGAQYIAPDGSVRVKGQ
jgi:hypothetical protein